MALKPVEATAAEEFKKRAERPYVETPSKPLPVAEVTKFADLPISKPKCPAGHEYDDANTRYVPDGTRQCRECDRIRHSERRLAFLPGEGPDKEVIWKMAAERGITPTEFVSRMARMVNDMDATWKADSKDEIFIMSRWEFWTWLARYGLNVPDGGYPN